MITERTEYTDLYKRESINKAKKGRDKYRRIGSNQIESATP
jgi:hypothetical protein